MFEYRGDDGGEEYARSWQRRTNGKHDQRIKVLTPAELAARPRPKWLVRDVLLETGLAVVYGASGAGKTFAVLDMVCAIVRGLQWFGRRTRQGRVVYVAAEGALALRLAAYCDQHGVSFADDLAGLGVVEQSVNLLAEDGDLADLVIAIRAHVSTQQWSGVDAIVIDTLNRAMPGGNENASEDMGRMVKAGERLGCEFGCVVIYVHHAGKDEARGSRGHSSLKAATDAEIAINRSGELRVVHAGKVREGEDGVDLGAFTLEWVDLGPSSLHDLEAGPDERDGSCVVVPCDAPGGESRQKLSSQQALALKYLHRTIDDCGAFPPGQILTKAGRTRPREGQLCVQVESWRKHCKSAGGLSDRDDDETNRRAFNRVRRALETREIIGVFEGWVWLRDGGTN